MFDVVLLFGSKIYCFSGVPARDKPTYGWSWEKHYFRRSIPTKEKACPWDLLIVIVNNVFMGNYSRLKDINKSWKILELRI